MFPDVAEALSRIQEKKPQLVIISGNRICLVRHDDQFSAVQDRCTHNGESLSLGHVNYLGEIICPMHNYCFNMKTGNEISGRSDSLKTYPIKIDDSGFFIGI